MNNEQLHPIKRRRKQALLTLRDLGALSGVHFTLISRYEGGVLPARVQHLRDIARVLRISLSLLTREVRAWERAIPDRFTRADPAAGEEIPW